MANGRKKAIQRDGCSQFQRQLELIKIDQEIRKQVEEHATAETNTLGASNNHFMGEVPLKKGQGEAGARA